MTDHTIHILTAAELREERQRTAAAWRFILLYLATVVGIGALLAGAFIADRLWTL